jgi:ribosomal protein L11 methyltransferase
LVALLSNEGYEGFEELSDALIAYCEVDVFDEKNLQEILASFALNYKAEFIEKTNWNETWESNFQPVILKDFCTVRAKFHHIEINTPFEIVVTPKMSFGTGHHATTKQMMSQMKDIDFKGKTVLDLGTGTGILAILATLLGASRTLAIDNDEWSVMNAKENVDRNNVTVEVSIEPLENFATLQFDVLFANINLNVLLQYMNTMSAMTKQNCFVLMSGLLTHDQQVIEDAAKSVGMMLKKRTEELNWISLLFEKTTC